MVQLGAEIHIDMYDDRIEITNPGGMVEGKPIQDRNPRHVPSKTRNPVIADMFSRMNYMERRGSGFKKILDDYQAQDKYEEKFIPEFYSDSGDFRLILWNLNYSAQVKEQVSAQVKEQVVEIGTILDYCKTPRSKVELTTYFGFKSKNYFTRKYLKPLIEEGLIMMTVPDKPNSQNQRYYSLGEKILYKYNR